MPIMDQGQADALLSKGQISPEQHAAISASNGVPVGVAAPLAPTSSEPTMSVEPPPVPVDQGPPLPPDAAPVPLAGGMSTTAPAMSVAEPTMSLTPPPGEVQVGPIAQTNKPAPPPPPAPSYGASVGRMGATVFDKATGELAPEPAPKPVDPRVAAQAVRDEQLGVQAQAAKDAGATRAERGRELADTYDAFTKQQQANDAAAAAERVKDEAAISATIADINHRVDEYATKQVDPDQFWKNQTAGSTIVGLLGAAIGGAAAVMTKTGVNEFMRGIERRVEQDIRAQEADLMTAGKSIDAKRGVLHDMMQATGSKEAARSAARIAALSNVEMQAKTLAAKYDPRLENANTQAILAGIETQKANEREKLDMTMRAERAAQAAAARAAAVAERNYRDQRDDKKFDQGAKYAEIGNKRRELDIEAQKAGAAGAKPEAKQDAEYATAMKAFNAAWKEAVETNPGGRLSGALGRVGDTDEQSVNKGALGGLVGFIKGVGDSDAASEERLKDMLPKPGDDERTLQRKYAMVASKIATSHPEAAQRFEKRAIPTVAAPGSGAK